MSFEDRLDMLVRRHDELRDTLGAGKINGSEFAKYSKEYSDLTPLVETIQSYQQAMKSLSDLKQMIADPSCDAEMKEMAEQELYDIEHKLPEMTRAVQVALLPKDDADDKNAILE